MTKIPRKFHIWPTLPTFLYQFYEICFELSWKTMKDYLESEGFEVKSPREAIKLAFQTGLVEDGELWIEALEARNMTSHIYDEETINKIVRTQRLILSEFGREATPEELAKKLRMPLDKVRKVLKISKAKT